MGKCSVRPSPVRFLAFFRVREKNLFFETGLIIGLDPLVPSVVLYTIIHRHVHVAARAVLQHILLMTSLCLYVHMHLIRILQVLACTTDSREVLSAINLCRDFYTKLLLGCLVFMYSTISSPHGDSWSRPLHGLEFNFPLHFPSRITAPHQFHDILSF